MTAAQSVQGQTYSFDGAILRDGVCCVLGTAGEKAATAAKHGADRVSVKGYQRQQQVFHRLIVEVRSPCSTRHGFPAPLRADQELMAWRPAVARNRLSEAAPAAGGTAPWRDVEQGFDQRSDAGSVWRQPDLAGLPALRRHHEADNVAGNADFSVPS